MRAVYKSLRSRVVRLAALLVVLGGTMGLMAPVDVAQSAICRFRPVVRTYYSDATHTTVVGQRGLDCGCNDASWGITTEFVTSETLCCPHKTC